MLHMQKQVYLDTTVTTRVSNSIAVTGLPTDGELGAIEHVLNFLTDYGFPIRPATRPALNNLFSYANNGVIFIKLDANIQFGMNPTPTSSLPSSSSSSQQRTFPAIANFSIPAECGKLMNTIATKRSPWVLNVQAISDTLFLQTHPTVSAVAMFPISVLIHDAYALLHNYFAKHPLSANLLLQTFQLRLGNRGNLINVHAISIVTATAKDHEAIRSQLLHGDEVSVIQIGLTLVAIASKKETAESFWVGHKQFRDAIPFSSTITGCTFPSTIEFLRSLELKIAVHPTEPSAPIRSIALGNFVISNGNVTRDGTAVVALNEALISTSKQMLAGKVAELCPYATSIVIRGSDLSQTSFVTTSSDYRDVRQQDKTGAAAATGRKRKKIGSEDASAAASQLVAQPPPNNSSSSVSYPTITDGKETGGRPKPRSGKAGQNIHSQVAAAASAPVISTALAVSAPNRSRTKTKEQQQLFEWQVATEANVNTKIEQIRVTQSASDQRISNLEGGVADILSLLQRAEARRLAEARQAGDGDVESNVGKS